MHPTMTSMPSARAVAVMRNASRSEPHLASLMLMPSAASARRGMSRATRQLSSTTTGRWPAAARTRASPSRSAGGSGCSSSSTPNSLSNGSIWRALAAVQPALASTRIGLSVASRIVRSSSSSRSVPSLILRIGYAAASWTFSRILSGVSMPIVNDETGVFCGSSPHSRHNGWPRRLPTRSWRATESAARAAPFLGTTCANRVSADSRSNGSSGM